MLIFISVALLNKMGAHPLLLTRARCVAYATLIVGACVATIAIYARFAVYEFFVAMFTVLVVLDVGMGLTWSSKQRVSTWAVYASIACIALGKVCWEIEVRVCSIDARVWPLHVVWHGLSCASAYYGLLADMACRIDCGLSAGVTDGVVSLDWAGVPFREVRVVVGAEPAAKAR